MLRRIFLRINNSNLGSRLIKGITWSLIGSILGKGLMIIGFIFVARILGKDEYGKFGMIRSSVIMFLSFSSMGMGLTASRYIAFFRNTDKNKTYKIYKSSLITVLLFGIIISLFVIIFSSTISNRSFGTNSLSLPLKISVVALFFGSITSAQNGALSGLEKFKSIGINTTKSGIIQILLLTFGAFFYGLNGVILALGISTFTLFIFHYFSLEKSFKEFKLFFSGDLFDPEIKRIFIKFSLPAVLSGLVSAPVLWWSKTYLVRNSNFGEMAIFDVAEQWNIALLFIPVSISTIILPLLSNILAEGKNDQYDKLIKINLLINGGIAFIFALIFIPLSPYILKLYGTKFNDYLPLQIMLITAILQAINGVLGQVIVSKGKMWIGLFVNLLWGIWLITFSWYFIYRLNLGALGMSYAMLTSYLLHSMIQGIVAFKIKI